MGKQKKLLAFLVYYCWTLTPSNQFHPTEEPNIIIENHFCKQINNNSDIKAGRPAFILTKKNKIDVKLVQAPKGLYINFVAWACLSFFNQTLLLME